MYMHCISRTQFNLANIYLGQQRLDEAICYTILYYTILYCNLIPHNITTYNIMYYAIL